MLIIGFGAFEEVWTVRYEVLPGDPAQHGVWDRLDGVLLQPYRTGRGPRDPGPRHLRRLRRPPSASGVTYCRTRRSRLPDQGCCRAAADMADSRQPDEERRRGFT